MNKEAKILLPKRFHKEDIDAWKRVAAKENRNLTNWMETVLNAAAKPANNKKRLNE